MFVMFVLALKSSLQLRSLKRSALPLQNTTIYKLYKQCLSEMKITRTNIPIYSTAFLKTPIITGIFKPGIYMPIHLISDYHETDVRYIFCLLYTSLHTYNDTYHPLTEFLHYAVFDFFCLYDLYS